MEKLKERICDISRKYQLAHVGSNLSAVDIIDSIYSKITSRDIDLIGVKPEDIFILSSGHAGIALFVVLEKYYGIDAEFLFKKHGIHSTRDLENRITCTTGSLGHGIGVAVGMALADRSRDVYCLTSDGEWMEGSMWEALRLAKQLDLTNLHIYANANGYGGMQEISAFQLRKQLASFDFPLRFIFTNTEPLKGLEAHYQKV